MNRPVSRSVSRKTLESARQRLLISKSLLGCVLSLGLMLSGTACQSLKTREQVGRGSTPGAAPAPGERAPAPTPAPSPQGSEAPTAPPSATVTPPSAPAPAPESFLTKEPPKVGLILGPGGMKSYAHIGVLKEISRARMPIKGVVGLEWGAVIGGLYSMQGQVNEVEWKSFKLREDDIPSNGLLSKAINPEKAADLRGFLSTIFSTNKLERGKIDFACPAYNIRTERFVWFNKGTYKDVVGRCFAYPPYYKDTDGWLAAPFAIEEAAQYLRDRGANLIIYVNALGRGELFNPALIDEHYADYVLWAEARRHAARPRLPGINAVININTGSYDVTDYAGRRQLMEAGSRAAQSVINKLVTQHGF